MQFPTSLQLSIQYFISETTFSTHHLPLWRKAINFLCGISDQKGPSQNPEDYLPKISKEEEAKNAAESLEEQPSWKR